MLSSTELTTDPLPCFAYLSCHSERWEAATQPRNGSGRGQAFHLASTSPEVFCFVQHARAQGSFSTKANRANVYSPTTERAFVYECSREDPPELHTTRWARAPPPPPPPEARNEGGKKDTTIP